MKKKARNTKKKKKETHPGPNTITTYWKWFFITSAHGVSRLNYNALRFGALRKETIERMKWNEEACSMERATNQHTHTLKR